MLKNEYSVILIGQDTLLNGTSNEYFNNGKTKQLINYDHGVLDS